MDLKICATCGQAVVDGRPPEVEIAEVDGVSCKKCGGILDVPLRRLFLPPGGFELQILNAEDQLAGIDGAAIGGRWCQYCRVKLLIISHAAASKWCVGRDQSWFVHWTRHREYKAFNVGKFYSQDKRPLIRLFEIPANFCEKWRFIN